LKQPIIAGDTFQTSFRLARRGEADTHLVSDEISGASTDWSIRCDDSSVKPGRRCVVRALTVEGGAVYVAFVEYADYKVLRAHPVEVEGDGPPIKKMGPGYVFETVFRLERQQAQPPRLVARHINGKRSKQRIVSADPRVLPGRRCKVKVEAVAAGTIEVAFLGLVDFGLDKDVYVDPDLLQAFEVLLCSGRSILLEGPQGTGKTTVAAALAHSLGMEYVFFNCSICFEPSDFVGSLQLLVDEQGHLKTEWVPTEVLQAVLDANANPGLRYLVFLDELNRTRSQALNGIMSAIDSSRRIFDPRQNQYIPIPDNVQWIAAINRGRQFVGTYQIDAAQLDRFAVLKMDYLPEEQETRILATRYDMVKPRLIRKVVRIANNLRADERLLTDLSMRATDEACLFLSYPSYRKVTPEQLLAVLRISFCNRFGGRIDEPGSEAQVAHEIVERGVILRDDVGS
jgi:MoxR-like ATPase